MPSRTASILRRLAPVAPVFACFLLAGCEDKPKAGSTAEQAPELKQATNNMADFVNQKKAK